MPTDRTQELRRLLQEFHKERPVDKSPRKPKSDDAQRSLNKEYLTEAYNILNHINTLTRMLAAIRKPYLNIDSRNVALSRRNIDITDQESSWSGVRYLSNEERDQIDVQARVILTRSADRVKEMEALEKRRAASVGGHNTLFNRLVPARLRQDAETVASDFVAAHHASITWYLNRRLTEASQSQKEMQEERVKRQMERAQTLGAGAAREAVNMQASMPANTTHDEPSSTTSSWLGNAPSNLIAAAIGAPSPTEPIHRNPTPPPIITPSLSDDEDDDIELTQSQILQFETENANILRSVQDTLESVQQAEARLMDISALQMELVNHLTQQTELTDQLYEDAMATTATVEKGNEQLREARRRAKDSRYFILVFLLGASLSLLFLHYY